MKKIYVDVDARISNKTSNQFSKNNGLNESNSVCLFGSLEVSS